MFLCVLFEAECDTMLKTLFFSVFHTSKPVLVYISKAMYLFCKLIFLHSGIFPFSLNLLWRITFTLFKYTDAIWSYKYFSLHAGHINLAIKIIFVPHNVTQITGNWNWNKNMFCGEKILFRNNLKLSE